MSLKDSIVSEVIVPIFGDLLVNPPLIKCIELDETWDAQGVRREIDKLRENDICVPIQWKGKMYTCKEEVEDG